MIRVISLLANHVNLLGWSDVVAWWGNRYLEKPEDFGKHFRCYLESKSATHCYQSPGGGATIPTKWSKWSLSFATTASMTVFTTSEHSHKSGNSKALVMDEL